MKASSAKNLNEKTSQAIAWLIVTTVSAFKLYYAIGMNLHPDEAYYWDWSRHLDWAYYDQGPATGFYIRFFTLLFGNTIVALKTAAVAASLIAHMTLYYTARRVLPPMQSLLFLLVTLAIPGFFSGSFLIMHDSVLILFWSFAVFFMIRWIQNKRTVDLYLLFIAMGLGFLSKHTMVFFGISFALWFIFTPEFWPEIKRGRIYGAIAIAALIASPFFIWNMKHEWDGIGAIINLRSSGGQFANKNTTGLYIFAQSMLFSPVWFVLFLAVCGGAASGKISGAIELIRSNGIKKAIYETMHSLIHPETSASSETHTRRFIWIIALVLPLFFLCMSRGREVQPNWPLASYGAMMLVVFLSALFERKWLRVIFYVGLIFPVLFATFFLFSKQIAHLAGVQPSPKMTRVFPHLRLAGFPEVIKAVEKQRNEIDPGAQILTNRYQDAAMAGFLLPGQPQIGSINVLQRNEYSYWPAAEKKKNYIIFSVNENTCIRATVFFVPVLHYMFETVKQFPEQEIMMDGVAVKRYQVWYVQNYKRDWRGLLYHYMLESAIYDLMPNLRGSSLGTTTAEGMSGLEKYMNENYFARKGGADCE